MSEGAYFPGILSIATLQRQQVQDLRKTLISALKLVFNSVI